MTQPRAVILFLLLSPAAAIHSQQSGPATAVQLRRIPLTRTLHIPATQAPARDAADSRPASPALAVWPGATDEPPEGPTGFDVLDDGSIVITDPLLRRLSLFDPQGRFKRTWDLGFPADSVTVAADGQMLIREANTGQLHTLDREGNIHAGQLASPPVRPEARFLSGQSGTISSSNAAPTPVRFNEPGSAMVALEALPTEPGRGAFVAIEASVPEGGADSINVRKLVRRYSPEGALVAETAPIPLDYYVLPVDELRVRKGVVYQLMTTRTEIRINEWDMN